MKETREEALGNKKFPRAFYVMGYI